MTVKQKIIRRIAWVADALVGAAVFFLVWGTLVMSYGKTAQGVMFERFAGFEFALGGCLFLWFLASFVRGKISVARMPTDGLFLFLFAVSVVSALFSGFAYRGVWGTFENPFSGIVGLGSLCVLVFFLASVFSRYVFWMTALAVLASGWTVFGGMAHLSHFPELSEGGGVFSATAIALSGMLFCVALIPRVRARKNEWYVLRELRFVGQVLLLVSFGVCAVVCVRLFSEGGMIAATLAFGVFALFLFAKKVRVSAVSVLLTGLMVGGIAMAGVFGAHLFGTVETDRFPDTATLQHIAWKSLEQSPVLGYGPGLYGKAYALHKPAEINQTTHATDRFSNAPGGLWEGLSTVGVLGTVVFFLIVAGFAGLGWYTLKNDTATDNRVLLAIFSSWVGLLPLLVWYAYDGGMLFLFFLYTGMLLGNMRERTFWVTPRIQSFSLRVDPRYTLVFVFSAIFVAGSGALFLYRVGEKAVAGHWAYLARQASSPEEAVSFLEKAMQRDAKEPEYGRRLGEVLAAIAVRDSLQKDADVVALETRFNRAFEVLARSVDASPGDVTAVESLARAYENSAVTVPQVADSALKQYALAESMDPTNPVFPFKRGVILLQQVQENPKMEEEAKKKKLAESLDRLGDAIVRAPNFPLAYYESAMVYREKGEHDRAVENAKKAAEMSPNESAFLILLASLYGDDATKADEMKGLLDRARRISPEDPMVYLYLGKYYSGRALVYEAKEAYGQAMALVSDRQEGIKKYIEKLIQDLDGPPVPSENTAGIEPEPGLTPTNTGSGNGVDSSDRQTVAPAAPAQSDPSEPNTPTPPSKTASPVSSAVGNEEPAPPEQAFLKE